MRYLSMFSGIEAASVAWRSLGWTCAAVAEIEPFPSAVLAYHFPDTPNLGDITKITKERIESLGKIDLMVFGFPCQDLSIAGNRKGLTHADGTLTRSGLFFTAIQIAEWSRARWLVGENVPGLFSSNAGRDFGAVVGELAGVRLDVPRDGWANAGVALGPRGLVEWATLDAQYCRVDTHTRAVPQRRRRVFFVRDSGAEWQHRPPLFLIPESLRGNPPPSRSTGERIAGSLSARTEGGGGLGTDFELGGGQTTTEQCAAHTLLGKPNCSHAADQETYVAHALRGEGHDASEDGTGRGTPIIPALACCDATREGTSLDYETTTILPMVVGCLNSVGGHAVPGNSIQDTDKLLPVAFDTTQITSPGNVSNPQPGDPCHPLAAAAHPPTVAFAIQERAVSENPQNGPQGGGVREGVAFTIEARNKVQAVAFEAPVIAIQDVRAVESKGQNGRGWNDDGAAYTADAMGIQGVAQACPVADTLGVGANQTTGFKTDIASTGMAVRRLTPRECARLQGFPDDWTLIPWRGKPASECPDGPQYKAYGNSFATNVIRWIGRRIQMVDSIPKSP